MSKRSKYKVEDKVEFIFAGAPHTGKIQEVRKNSLKYSYAIHDGFYFYPVDEEKIIKKL